MKKKKKALPGIKKDLKYFLLSEEGKVTKQSIAKIGMGLTMAGIMLHAAQSSFAQHSSGTDAHSSSLGGATDGHQSHASHASHSAHSAHSAHGSHGSHGQW